MRSRALILALIAWAPLQAAAESALVLEGSRVVGWPVYDREGTLGFASCDGATRSLSAGGSFEAAEQACDNAPAPFQLRGQVHAIAPERSRLELAAPDGTLHMLYLSPEAAVALAELPPGAVVEVTGPVAGHAAALKPAS